MKMSVLVFGLSACLTCPIAFAGDSGAYAGVAVGRSAIAFNGADFNSPTPNPVNAREGTSIGKDTSYRFLFGYRFDKTWSVETGYTHHGNFQFRSMSVDSVGSIFDYSASSWFLAGKASFPINGKVNLFARGGLSVNVAKNNFWLDTTHELLVPLPAGYVVSSPALTYTINPGSYSKTTTAPLVGIGIEYAIWKNMKFRLEYEDYGNLGDAASTGRAKLSMTSLGCIYEF